MSSLRLATKLNLLRNFSKFQQLRLLSDQTKKSIETAINGKDICLFMKGTPDFPQCGFSRAAVQILSIQGITEYNHVNVLADEEIRNGIKEFSSWPTIPQLYIKGEFVGGCDIMMKMHQSGDLEKLLLEKKIVAPFEEEEAKN